MKSLVAAPLPLAGRPSSEGENSLKTDENTLLGLVKFPVQVLGDRIDKRKNFMGLDAQRRVLVTVSDEIPCIFSLLAGNFAGRRVRQ